MPEHNGHKNRNHWNVALWLHQDPALYRRMCSLMAQHSSKDTAARVLLTELPTHTPDGVKYTFTTVRKALVAEYTGHKPVTPVTRNHPGGLTYVDWCNAAAMPADSHVALKAWKLGEDPTEYRATKGQVSKMKYRIIFHGRKIGAIGVSSFQVVDVEAESEEAARHKAYDTHEHIGGGLEGIQVKALS